MESILKRGLVVPPFTLPDTDGKIVQRTAYQGKQHLVLVFLPALKDTSVRAYLQELSSRYRALQAAGGEVLVILRGSPADSAAIQNGLQLPFPTLNDADGKVTARYLPIGARAAVFVTDRYGTLHFDAPADIPLELPPTEEVQEWLETVDYQCSI